MFEIRGKHTVAKVMIDNIDETTMSQIYGMVSHEAFTSPVAIMPDTHAGKGSVVGFTMPLTDKIIPNVVGVDLSCTVSSICYGKGLFDTLSLEEFDRLVREKVPFGFSTNEDTSPFFNIESFMARLGERLRVFTMEYNKRYGTSYPLVKEALFAMFRRVGGDVSRIVKSIGTVGGGNHFIEVGKDLSDNYWVTVHCGSRNLGKCVAEYWQEVARKTCNAPVMSKDKYVEWVKENYDRSMWQSKIAEYSPVHKSSVPKGMEYLTGEDMYKYLVDTIFAHEYALENHRCIHAAIKSVLPTGAAYNHIITTHNKIDLDDWVIRKGAVRASKGEVFLCPMNMRDGILVCEGKGNEEWNQSAPHGAGRVLSRSQAKKLLVQSDANAQMEGIYSSCIPLDEAPDAYKDSKVIEECIAPTATIINRIIPVLNMKAMEG